MPALPYRPLFVLSAVLLGACTTILGDDFEIGTDDATATSASSSTASMGGEASVGGNGSATSSTGGTGGAPGESCTNGTDDDGDGDVDCADADCGAFACIPAVPPGWVGPINLGQVPYGDPKPTCPSSYPNEAHNGVTGLTAAPASCNSCSCSASNPTCTPAGISHYTQSGCGGFPAFGSNVVGGCVQMGAFPGTISVRIGNPTASVSCTAQGGGVANLPAVDWAFASRACSYDGALGGGCAAGEVCAPALGDPDFGTLACILKAGDEMCPDPFSVKRLYSDSDTGVNDTRACSACGCMQQSASCALSTQFFNNASCTGTATFNIANNNTCSNSNINGLYARAIVTGSPSGTCSVNQQSTPQGGVTATGPFTTVCCLP